MTTARIFSSCVFGIDAYALEVETDISEGLPAFHIVGLPDTAIKESRDRIKSAIKNSGFVFPANKITVNLAPANIKKEGSFLDLPVALSILGTFYICTHYHYPEYFVKMDVHEVELKKGKVNVIFEMKNTNSMLFYLKELKKGNVGLCISRESPEKLKARYPGLKESLWLSNLQTVLYAAVHYKFLTT